MEKILLYIVSIFFVVGAIDYFEGNRLKLGSVFEEGIKTMGPLVISMIGILSITPLVAKLLSEILSPISKALGLDPSVFPASFIAVDMGAYNISLGIANTENFAVFSGIIIASILGCTLSFTLPLALGLVKEEYMSSLTKGILCGIITIPVALFIGGLLLDITIGALLINILPIILLAILLSLGIVFKPKLTLIIFKYIGRLIVFASTIGLIVQGIFSISGIEILSSVMPLKEALYIVGKIAIFLGGAYVMLECVQKLLKKQLSFIGKKIGINNESVAALIGSLASAIIVFSNFEKLDEKGRIICSAFSVSGAYVLGGQLGFVASVEGDMISVYLITKIIAGVLSIILALYIINIEEKKKNNFNKLITEGE
ncbi:ethanolamine utilization protein EutH [Clostridium sp. LP20]|uniref:ethanolamine utilization protein EutH n=1 Tax=Clostridium sp. LP20 TaxID=3418665 RepID=UPI003EE4714B